MPLVDRRTCHSDDLSSLYAELGGAARALEAQRLAIAAVLDERDAWGVDGARDMVAAAASSPTATGAAGSPAVRPPSASTPTTSGSGPATARPSPAERMGVFVRAWGLSDREAELVGHLLTAADTGEVAGQMFLSHHTVQDHLKSIFAKTGAHNRRTLLARVVGR